MLVILRKKKKGMYICISEYQIDGKHNNSSGGFRCDCFPTFFQTSTKLYGAHNFFKEIIGQFNKYLIFEL